MTMSGNNIRTEPKHPNATLRQYSHCECFPSLQKRIKNIAEWNYQPGWGTYLSAIMQNAADFNWDEIMMRRIDNGHCQNETTVV